jgi:hypothetical protein
MCARLFATAVAGLLMLPLAACASSDPSPGAAGRAAPVPGVCDGVPKCRVVANTDVDGDGRADEVGFVVESKRRVTVRVTTATGETVGRDLDTMWFPRGEFFGAAPIDGRPGAELVVGTTMGAHTLWFTTLAMDSGRLEVLAAPGAESEWMIDGAYSFHAGVSRQVENGRAVVVLREAARNGVAPRFSGRDRTYVWTASGWRLESTERTRYRGERAVARIGGWHVAGLPTFPQF